MKFNFALDEQIILRNMQSNKTYALTINQYGRAFDVTREWTVPNQEELASKTDRFYTMPQAAKLLQELYETRVRNGYQEILRRPNMKKSASKVETHKVELAKSDIPQQPVTSVPGQRIDRMITERQKTGIFDRIKY